MDLTRGRGLYGRGGRPRPLSPGPLPGLHRRNPESLEFEPEVSNASQTAETDEQSPGDAPQSSNVEQAPPYQAEGPQTYTPGSHPENLASLSSTPEARNASQTAQPTASHAAIDAEMRKIEDVLRERKINNIPPLEDCQHLIFEQGGHDYMLEPSGSPYADQRLRLGTMDRSGQHCKVYMYLIDYQKKPVVEVEVPNPQDQSISRKVLSDREIWNEVDLVEPIRTSRANIVAGSKNWQPYEALARYYFLQRHHQLGRTCLSQHGKWLTTDKGKMVTYLQTAGNNIVKEPETIPRGKRQAKPRKNGVPKGKKSTKEPPKDQGPIPEESSSEGHDRSSDENFSSPRTKRPPRKNSTRRSTTIEPQPHDISNIPYETLSNDELSTLILLASQELRRRGSTPLLDSHSPGTAPQSRETGHTSMHPALLQGRFADPTDFEEPGPGYSSNYDGPF